MKPFALLFSVVLLLLLTKELCAVTINTDSLRNELTKKIADTNRVNTLLNLGGAYRKTNADSCILFAKEAQVLCEKLIPASSPAIRKKLKDKLSSAYSLLGIANWYKSEPQKAKEYYLKAMAIAKETKNAKTYYTMLGNIGMVYDRMGEFEKAIEFYQKALKMTEELHDSTIMSNAYINLANVNLERGKQSRREVFFRMALVDLRKALIISRKINNPVRISSCLNNTGMAYFGMGELNNNNLQCDSALVYFNEALVIKKRLGVKRDMLDPLNNIGMVYHHYGNLNMALKIFQQILVISEEIGDKYNEANSSRNIATVFLGQGTPQKALPYASRSLELAKTMGDKPVLISSYRLMKEVYTALHKYEDALVYYALYSDTKDTLLNEQSDKNILEMQAKYENDKKEQQIALMAKEKQVQQSLLLKNDATIRQQKIQRVALLGGLLLMLLVAVLTWRSYKIKKADNAIITLQKEEMELQKLVVEQKNKEIIDSINYAKRLQQAILPPLHTVKEYLPGTFILYKPKDIVAGDFYWMEVVGDTVFIAAADCTGHGVPGAMVSVVCSNALSRTVKEFKLTDPGKIIDKARELVIETFEKSVSEVMDGMDISLCAIHKPTLEIAWAGANSPLWYTEQGEMKEIKANKQPVGIADDPKPFTNHILRMQPGAILYLFTDGYADQFGGPKGKKFKYKQLKELLISNGQLPMEQQKRLLDATLEQWRGKLEQVDDILIIGIQV